VDDRVSSLEVRRTLLCRLGYDVLVASDPPSALAILNTVDVDLVILDYSFPGHMSGEELAREIRAHNPQLPLIMLSGYPDLPASARESADALILKGAAGPADLLNTIRSLLKKAPPHPERPPLQEQSRVLLDKSSDLVQRLKESQERRDKTS
jgi:CheY-like chemotaxis protein